MPGMLNAAEKAALKERTSAEMAQNRHEKGVAESRAELDHAEVRLKSVREKQAEMQQGREKAAEQYRKGEITQEKYSRDIQFYNTRERHYIEEEKSLMATREQAMARHDLAVRERERVKQEPQRQNAWACEETRELNRSKEQGR